MTRLSWVIRSAFIPVFLLLVTSAAQAQLVVYDSFAGPKLDADKWIGRDFATRQGGTGSLLEIQREITPIETLVLQARSVGGDASDTGLFSAENALVFRHSHRLADISFVLSVRSAQATSCSASGNAAVAARGVYPFFNDGSGDVIAIIEAVRSTASSASLEVVGSLIHRGEAGDELLGSVSLGFAELNTKMKLRVKWDAAGSRVRFSRDDVGGALAYTNVPVADAQGRKYLGANTIVPDCTGGAVSSAAITALFNNVRVNP